jgi:hypothetical protein
VNSTYSWNGRSTRSGGSNKADALLVGADSLFNTRRVQLATLARRHAIPAVYFNRQFAEAGGLMSYRTIVLAATGYNFRRLLAWLRFLLLRILIALGLADQFKLA